MSKKKCDMPAMDEDGLPVQIGDGRILADKANERFRFFSVKESVFSENKYD